MPTARPKSAVARGGTGAGGAGGVAGAGAAAPEGAPGATGLGAAAGCALGDAAALDGTAALGGSARCGVLLQAHSSTAHSAAGPARSVDLSDHILRQLRLAVARGFQLRERAVALAHPFVVDT